MAPVATERAVPILPTRDLAESLAFYERLGFENIGDPPETWGYCILARGRIELHLALDPETDPLSTASSCYVYVDDAQALHDAWAPSVVPDAHTGMRVVAPVDTGYGMREFAVVDPSGNLLRIGSPGAHPAR
ncbi:bleomycin resistance protein [Propioniciclava soli]|uniref:bleomycin resistance protein n=1 Tax=Propioniciclava soli TaxID=2775081 RepID=UPI001E2CA24D|nr:VOC family protein [Propioniciclava soli]